MYEGLRATWICSRIQKNALGLSAGTYIIYIYKACGVLSVTKMEGCRVVFAPFFLCSNKRWSSEIVMYLLNASINTDLNCMNK